MSLLTVFPMDPTYPGLALFTRACRRFFAGGTGAAALAPDEAQAAQKNAGGGSSWLDEITRGPGRKDMGARIRFHTGRFLRLLPCGGALFPSPADGAGEAGACRAGRGVPRGRRPEGMREGRLFCAARPCPAGLGEKAVRDAGTFAGGARVWAAYGMR